jgi:membrane protein DedA with SNARE-associated domain
VISDFLTWLQNLPEGWLILGAGLLVFGETCLGLGFVAPGETGLFILGVTVDSVPEFVAMWLVTTGCAMLGYTAGYWLGRYFGPKLRNVKFVDKHGGESWDKAVEFLQRRGAVAVMIAIFLPVMRTLVPAAAGAAKLPFHRFLPAAGVAGLAWCALHVGIGAALGESAKWLESAIGKGSWVVLGVLVAGFVVIMLLKRKRKAAAERQAGVAPEATATEPEPQR